MLNKNTYTISEGGPRYCGGKDIESLSLSQLRSHIIKLVTHSSKDALKDCFDLLVSEHEEVTLNLKGEYYIYKLKI